MGGGASGTEHPQAEPGNELKCIQLEVGDALAALLDSPRSRSTWRSLELRYHPNPTRQRGTSHTRSSLTGVLILWLDARALFNPQPQARIGVRASPAAAG